jgi:hypothetical protein
MMRGRQPGKIGQDDGQAGHNGKAIWVGERRNLVVPVHDQPARLGHTPYQRPRSRHDRRRPPGPLALGGGGSPRVRVWRAGGALLRCAARMAWPVKSAGFGSGGGDGDVGGGGGGFGVKAAGAGAESESLDPARYIPPPLSIW